MRTYAIVGLTAVVAAMITAVPAQAVEFEAGLNKTVRDRCHMDSCSFSIIRAVVPVANLPDGTLFAVSADVWGAYYNPANEEAGHNEYDQAPTRVNPKKPTISMVFCSKTRPYAFKYYDGSWAATPLRPGDDAAVTGADESDYQDYWAACHHLFPKYATDPMIQKLAPKLGYHFSGGFPDDQPGDHIDKPSDLLRHAR